MQNELNECPFMGCISTVCRNGFACKAHWNAMSIQNRTAIVKAKSKHDCRLITSSDLAAIELRVLKAEQPVS